MTGLFLRILNMSLAAGWMVLAVAAVRLIFGKAPRALFVVMWALVGIRLVCPFSVESALSLLPSAEPVPVDIAAAAVPALDTGLPLVDSAVNPVLAAGLSPHPEYSADPMQIVTYAASVIWLVGVAVMLIYMAVSCIAIHLRVRESVAAADGTRICDRISAPFIFGVFRPRIYLPSDTDAEAARYIVAHEKAHIARRDHIWKPLGFMLLAVYWFNPLMWIAYILLCRDIESACDEKVISKFGDGAKVPYSRALLGCSARRRLVSACPLAFGETGVGSRVRKVLNYKKPAFWLIAASVLACAAVAVCFMTNPGNRNSSGSTVRFTGCGSDIAGVGFAVGGARSNGGLELSLSIRNKTSGELVCGTYFELLGEKNGEWEMLKPARPVAFEDIAYNIRSGGSCDLTYRISDGYDTATGKKYRLRTDIGASASEKKYVWIDFELIEGEPDGGTSYYAYGGNEWETPALSLDADEKTFDFAYSMLSSYMANGTYTDDGSRVVCLTDDGKYTYTFRRDGGALVFEADGSSPMPSYRYSEKDSVPTVCVPDGARFDIRFVADAVPVLPGVLSERSGMPSLNVSAPGMPERPSVRAVVGSYNTERTETGRGLEIYEVRDTLPVLATGVSALSAYRGNTSALTFDRPSRSIAVVSYEYGSGAKEDIENVTSDGGVYSFDMNEGKYVYGITAVWDEGSAEYGFVGEYALPRR